ncbi:LysR family transcriptional regulator [Azotobacter vinelandii]
MKLFIKVEELNSFTLAAEALCLTQAGVTLKKFKKLERMLGFLLFFIERHVAFIYQQRGNYFFTSRKSTTCCS